MDPRATEDDLELDARDRVERAIGTCFIAIRAVHLAQGVICTFRGANSYRRPRLAIATLALSTIETGWFVDRLTRRRPRESSVSWVDALFGVGGLVALGAATERRDRTTSMNWMLPYTVGAAAGTAIGIPGRSTRATLSMAMAATYAATVFADIEAGGAPAATAIANTASYAGFTAVVDVVVSLLRRYATELEQAKQQAVRQAAELGEARERDHQHRFLHDSVLQTLEALQKHWDPDDPTLRTRVHQDATRLRGILQGRGDTDESSLQAALAAVASESAALGLRVEIVGPDLDPGLPPGTVAALSAATREALTNVAKHADTSEVVVHVESADGGVALTIRDHGRGFDATAVAPGFGQRESIVGRVHAVGGTATIWSEPARGTRVRIWVPV